MTPVAFTLHNALTDWQRGPFPLVTVGVLLALAYFYLQGIWALAARGRTWPARRTIPFLGGLAAIDLAIQSPIATFTSTYFQAHVIQHLLLMVVAPPLLALGAPSTLLLQAANRKTKLRWLAILRSRPFAVLTHPVPVWFLYFGAMFAFFMTSLINIAMHDMAIMDVFNVTFLLGGTLYWWPMVGLDPIVHWKMGYGARMANLLIGAAPETFLGVAILGQSRPIASMYSLASTHAGGAMLWISVELSSIAGFVPVFFQWMHSEERTAARADARTSRATPLTPSEDTSEHVRQPAQRDRACANPGQLTGWEATWLARTGSIPAFAQEGTRAVVTASQVRGDADDIDATLETP